MNEDALEAKETIHLTLDQLFELSLQELRKSLGVPKVIEADKIVDAKPSNHVADVSKLITDAKGEE